LPSDTWVLGFDTSAAHCAAALLYGNTLIESHHEDMEKGQAERLVVMLEELLARHGISWHDLAAIGVGTGPGNFTGIRISVAAARGLALALGIPAIGVTGLEARAYGLPRPLAVVQDARRGEIYVQHFGPDTPPELTTLEALPKDLAARMPLVGSGAALIAGAMILPEAMPFPEAIARIASERRTEKGPRPAPLYLRAADATPSSDPIPVILP